MAYVKNFIIGFSGGVTIPTALENLFYESATFDQLVNLLQLDHSLENFVHWGDIEVALKGIIDNVEMSDRVKRLRSQYRINKADNEGVDFFLALTIDFGSKDLYDEYSFELKIG